MPVATQPTAAQLPLPGGRPGATVRVHPIMTGEMHAPRVFSDRPAGLLAIPKIAVQALGPRGGWDFSGFARGVDLFGDGSVRIVSTPGHTAGHQSVILRAR
jgi:glyoxylase-like metal-dependent hydrolase (beta-lactamase superfamily II)